MKLELLVLFTVLRSGVKSDRITIENNDVSDLHANEVETSEYWTGKPSPWQFPTGDYSAYGIRVLLKTVLTVLLMLIMLKVLVMHLVVHSNSRLRQKTVWLT